MNLARCKPFLAEMTVFVGILLCSSLALGGLQPAPTTQDTEAAISKLKAVLKGPMELSGATTSVTDEFSCRYLFHLPRTDNSFLDFQGIVVRDKDRAAIVSRSLDGLYFHYVTNQLSISIDPDNPKTLILNDHASPDFRFGVDQKSGNLVAHAGATGGASLIDIDFASELRDVLPFIISAKYEPETQEIVFSTKNTSSRVHLWQDQSKAPIIVKDWMIESKGMIIAISVSPSPFPPKDFCTVTRNTLTQRGIAFRDIHEGELVPLPPPPHFGASLEQRDAAKLLQTLFPDQSKDRLADLKARGIAPGPNDDDLLKLDDVIIK